MDNFSIERSFLKEQYHQANENMRDNYRKRDILLGFYLTLTALFYSDFFRTGDIDELINLILIVGLVVFGLCLGIVFTFNRGWHGIYVITMILIQQKVSQPESPITKKSVREVDFQFQLFTSAELFIYLAFSVIVFFNSLYGLK